MYVNISDIAFSAIDDSPTTVQTSTETEGTSTVSQLNCIDKCTSHCTNYANGTLGAGLNIPYKVDVKSLSSYRRRHQSAPD